MTNGLRSHPTTWNVFSESKSVDSGVPPVGVQTPPLSNPGANKIKIYSIFYCHFSENRPFLALKFKTRNFFLLGEDTQTPHPFWSPLSNIPGGNPGTVLIYVLPDLVGRNVMIIHKKVLCSLSPHKDRFCVWNPQKTQKKYKVAY